MDTDEYDEYDDEAPTIQGYGWCESDVTPTVVVPVRLWLKGHGGWQLRPLTPPASPRPFGFVKKA